MFKNVQLFSALGALLLAQKASAHGFVANWIIDDVSHSGWSPSNPPGNAPTANRPTDNLSNGFTDFNSPIVACGSATAGTGVLNWDIKAGSKIVAQWDQWPDSHKGPVIEYMAACGAATCDGVDAASLSWFKISESDFVDGAWASMTITNTKNWEFTIPSDLPGGAYLVRHEIIAMHSTGDPQVYPVCFQAILDSDGTATPAPTTTFPEAYTLNEDFKTHDLYGGDQTAFVGPGPAVYGGGGAGGGDSPAPAPPAASSSAAVSSSAAPSASGTVVAPSASASASASVSASSADEEYPAEPTATATGPVESAPVESTPASSVVAPSSASSSLPSARPSTAPTTPGSGSGSGGDGAMGGEAPAVTENGTRFEVEGGSYHDRASAVQASCMSQMNACKRWANGLPNAEVGAAMSSCDTQQSTCSASGRKRDVINRYSKRSLRVTVL